MRKAAPRCPAAFINVIAEEGNKDEAIDWLQSTWNELCTLRTALVKLGFTREQIDIMQTEGSLGSVF